jgi:hypothetical protein
VVEDWVSAVKTYMSNAILDDVAARIEAVRRHSSFSFIWGKPPDDEDWRRRVVALASFRTGPTVLIASRRHAGAYRAVAAAVHDYARIRAPRR